MLFRDKCIVAPAFMQFQSGETMAVFLVIDQITTYQAVDIGIVRCNAILVQCEQGDARLVRETITFRFRLARLTRFVTRRSFSHASLSRQTASRIGFVSTNSQLIATIVALLANSSALQRWHIYMSRKVMLASIRLRVMCSSPVGQYIHQELDNHHCPCR